MVKPEDALIIPGSPLVIESQIIPCPYSYRRRRGSKWRGTVRPRTFTRFQKVPYEAGFDLCRDWAPPEMYIGEDFQTPGEDEARLVAYFKYANACDVPALYVIQEFVNILSRSPLINILEVALSVTVPYRLREDT